MSTISISELKTNPAKAILQAEDYPVAVQKRNKIKAFLIGKELYEKIISLLEDYIDKKAIQSTNFSQGKDFDQIAKELDL